MNTKELGTWAQLWVAADLVDRGHIVSVPFGDNAPYDLIIDRNSKLERIQVKLRTARNGKLEVGLYTMQYDSSGETNNRTKMVKYEKEAFEWLAVVKSKFRGSSAVERSAVNRDVAGSIPAPGAKCIP